MNTQEPISAADEALLAEWFDEFVENVLEGRATDVDERIRQRPDLAQQVTESYLLAHRLAGRRLPTTPRVDGYEIVREIGRGGMGAVYLARHSDLGRLVALKILPTGFGLSERARQRFLAEARALAQLTDEHIVRIHNVISNGEALAFEMEWIDGPSLRDVLDRLRGKGSRATVSDVVAILGDGATRPPERTLLQWYLRLVATIARALGKVHRAGLVHRDVKPSNILLRRDGTPLLADFGLVRDTAVSATRTEEFVGTLNYASPEQLRAEGGEVDPRSDVYSLAATLWEMVVGAPPFDGRRASDILRRIEDIGAPRLRRFAPDAPRDLETILGKAMDPDPAARYVTMDAFADDLDLLLRWQPIHARPPGPFKRASRMVRRHRRVLIAGALGATVVAAAFVPPALIAREHERRDADVAAMVREANESLLSPSVRDRAWRQIVEGARHDVDRLQEMQPAGLAHALEVLDHAHRLDPQRADVAIDRVLLAVATGRTMDAISREGPASPNDLERLPPVTRAYAAQVARGELSPKIEPDDVRSASVEDRQSLGLLAFLIGDLGVCEGVWSGVDPLTTRAPLADAALGLLYAVDGRPERAYPRLLQATRAFPDNALVAVTLAEVAAALGDDDLAEHWLSRAERLGARPSDALLVKADLLRNRGDLDAARAAYATATADDPRVELRIAELERDAGRLDVARARLVELVSRNAAVVRARRDLARIALESGDRATFLAQAEWVVAADYCAGRSAGTRNDAVLILQEGGLRGLAARAAERTGPVRTSRWAPASFGPSPFPDVSAIESLVLRRAGFRRDLRERFPLPGAPAADAARVVAHTVCAATWFPELGLGMSAADRMLLTFASLATRAAWPKLVAFGAPLLLGEDRSGLAGRTLRSFDGDAPDDLLGSVAATGDVDGDGVGDYVIGTKRISPPTPGYARVISGADGTVLHEVRGPGIGAAVAGIGDIDGDDHADVAVTGYDITTERLVTGVVLLLSGADGHTLREVRSDLEADTFGTSIANLGDIDADGVPDLAIGAMGAMGGSGIVRLYSGADGRAMTTLHGPRGASFGAAIAGLEDIDGDGARDLVVGGMGKNGGQGGAWVYSTRSARMLFELDGDSDSWTFGASVSGGGDVNGDGVGDIVIGAPMSPSGDAGSVYVFSGRDGSRIVRIHGPSRRDALGWSVAICDVDGDGIADVIAGAATSSENGERAGALVAWSGRALRERRASEVVATVRGQAPGQQLGVEIAMLPDFLGPGRAAVLVTAPTASTRGAQCGRVWLLDLVPDPTRR